MATSHKEGEDREGDHALVGNRPVRFLFKYDSMLLECTDLPADLCHMIVDYITPWEELIVLVLLRTHPVHEGDKEPLYVKNIVAIMQELPGIHLLVMLPHGRMCNHIVEQVVTALGGNTHQIWKKNSEQVSWAPAGCSIHSPSDRLRQSHLTVLPYSTTRSISFESAYILIS
jgi:hypothetical protein